MKAPSYKTISANAATVNKEWIVVDAAGQPLGRMASKVAKMLRGKHKTNYTPHVDCGDNVIVLNADQVVLSGNKEETKEYMHYTGYPGGQRTKTVAQVRASKPTFMVEAAVRGMLPKTKLGRAIWKNMHVFVGNQHPRQRKQPKTVDLNTIK